MDKLSNTKRIELPPEEYERDYFEIQAREYILNDGWSVSRIASVIPYVRPTEADFILDAGCAYGAMTFEAFKRGANIVSLDYSKNAIECAQELKGILYKGTEEVPSFICASVTDIPFLDNLFTKIIAADIVEHLSNRQFESFIEEASRVLRPGGEIFIYTDNPTNVLFRNSEESSQGSLKSGNHTLIRRLRNRLAISLLMLLRERRGIRETIMRLLYIKYYNDRTVDMGKMEKYGYYHVDLKKPQFVERVLLDRGFKVISIKVMHTGLMLERLPFPFSALWGGQYLLIGKKIS